MAPDEFTINETYVDVGDGHQIYVQDWGNREAKTPIIFLHGGPGTGTSDHYKQRFNPYEQRVVFFDQRGSGKSLPYGKLEHNTIQDLVEDISKIAGHLNLQKFILTGGSWGTCLALAYALAHPERVISMALQGIFTGSRAEIEYLDSGGFRTFFPDAWENFLDQTPKTHHGDPTAYHIKRILGGSEAQMRESAYLYSNLENSLMSLDDRFTPSNPDDFDPIPTRIEVFYMSNGCFLPDRYILNNAHKLAMPIWIVQGRYDFVCPPHTAYELHEQLQDSTLIWTMAGHGNDRSTYDVMRTIRAHWS